MAARWRQDFAGSSVARLPAKMFGVPEGREPGGSRVEGFLVLRKSGHSWVDVEIISTITTKLLVIPLYPPL